MKEKVMLVISSSDFGGGTKHVQEIKNYLSDRYDFFLAAPENFLLLEDQKFLRIEKSRFQVKDVMNLRWFCKNSGIIILHSHGRGAALICRVLKMSLFPILHLYTLHGVHILFRNKTLFLLYKFYEKYFGVLDNYRIFVSQSEKSEYLKNWNNSEKHAVIYNAVEEVSNLANTKPKYDVGILTRLHPQKNLIEFLDIAAMLPKFKFVIAGDGPESVLLMNYKELNAIKNVDFVGYCSEKKWFFSNINVYLSTSLWEGLPYSVLESVSYGCPAVLKNVVGHTDFVENGVGASLYNEPADAILVLKKLLLEQHTYDEKVKELEWFKEKFSVENFVTNINDLYKSLTEKIR